MSGQTIDTERATLEEECRLAKQAGRGDHAAFTVLFERYKSTVYRFCLYMLNDVGAAEDVYQDVFIAFYGACRRGNEMTNVRGYLLTAARTRCVSALRNAGRTNRLKPEFDMIDRDASASDVSETLQSALQKILPQYREVILLFEVEGFSYVEISQQLGINHDTVKNRIYRAKQALQKLLRPVLRDETGLIR